MPLYEVTTKGEDAKRLIEATGSKAAIDHASHGRYSARTVTKASEIAVLMGAGVKLEVAGTHAPEPEAEPEIEQIEQTGDALEPDEPAAETLDEAPVDSKPASRRRTAE